MIKENFKGEVFENTEINQRENYQEKNNDNIEKDSSIVEKSNASDVFLSPKVSDEIEYEMSIYKRYLDSNLEEIEKKEIDEFADSFFKTEEEKEEFYNLLMDIRIELEDMSNPKTSEQYKIIFNNLLEHQISIKNEIINDNLKGFNESIKKIKRLENPYFSDLIEEELPLNIIEELKKDIKLEELNKIVSTILLESANETNIFTNDDGEVDEDRIIQELKRKINNDVVIKRLGRHLSKKMQRSQELFTKDVDNKDEIGVEKLKIDELDYLDRVVGLTDENKDEFLEELEKFRENNSKDNFDINNEVPKTKEIIENIRIINDAVSEVAKRYRNKESNIPIENIIITPSRIGGSMLWERYVNGEWSSLLNKIAIRDGLSKKKFFETVFHELIHSKFYNSLEVKRNKGDIKIDPDQIGASIHTPDGGLDMLEILNEAVTQDLTEKFIEDCRQKGILTVEEIEKSEAKENNTAELSPYVDALFIFKALVKKIFKVKSSEYRDENHLREVFIKAVANGNIDAIRDIIENSFGKGKFGMFADAESYYKNSHLFR